MHDPVAQHAEVTAWLRFSRAQGLDPELARLLLAKFGLPESILALPQGELAAIAGLDVARSLKAAPDEALLASIDKTRAWLDHPGRCVLTLADHGYPARLLHNPAPPFMLFVDGAISELDRPRLALIAGDTLTKDAAASAAAFGRALAVKGVRLLLQFGTPLSAAVLPAALELPGVDVIAVTDDGLDRITPASHLALARQMARQGALVSACAPGELRPRTAQREARSLIAGLASAVLVFEAALNSSAFRTAQLAGQWGKDLMAIPGSIHVPGARGCHRLIRDGARLVENVEDVLEEMRINI